MYARYYEGDTHFISMLQYLTNLETQTSNDMRWSEVKIIISFMDLTTDTFIQQIVYWARIKIKLLGLYPFVSVITGIQDFLAMPYFLDSNSPIICTSMLPTPFYNPSDVLKSFHNWTQDQLSVKPFISLLWTFLSPFCSNCNLALFWRQHFPCSPLEYSSLPNTLWYHWA